MNGTDELLLATTDTAKELKTRIHMHVAEIAYENQFVTETQKVDHGTVIHLEKIQFLHDNLLAASYSLGQPCWVDEMYLASLLNKGREVHTNGTTDPTALLAETVLKLNGDFKL
ncbi:hypothetical protein Pyn_17951 [Prunus yedoensis var. nudiflora]|uniref:Uncharacterized protein n=1 Tax=Prunus yedoensis var. nudiflora TaxID=2094558 RepID=A0A314YMS4_PRUYE|nr:hypothetical protein Pyn_17951 [Prunus yedoensis var. nudiflora]